MSVNTVKQDGSLQRIAGGTLYADAPIGTISPFGGSVVPSGYLLCNGQAVSRTTYAELFVVIGTAFGAGNGSTTFNVPDMRESVPKGAGLTGKTVGAHLDADGLAVGEFLDDRIGTNNRSIYTAKTSAGNVVQAGSGKWGECETYRSGATTEVKAVGVNYIIKAKQVAVPFDVAEYIRNVMKIETGTFASGKGKYEKSGHTVRYEYQELNTLPVGDYTIPIPYAPATPFATTVFWGENVVGYASINASTKSIVLHMTTASSVDIEAMFITAD